MQHRPPIACAGLIILRGVTGPVEIDAAGWPPRTAYRFLTSAVAPRPIAWVTTLDPATGVVNAAPFSWINSVCADPPMVMLAIESRKDGTPKDTVRNIRSSKEFVVNVVPKEALHRMVASSADYRPEDSEVEVLGLPTTPSRRVKPPRLAESPVHFECRLERILPLGRGGTLSMVLGEVVHAAADDAILDDSGNVDPERVTLVARMGGHEYTDTGQHYAVPRPPQPDRLRG